MKYTVNDLCNLEEFVEMERLQKIKMKKEQEKIQAKTVKIMDYTIGGLIIICVVLMIQELV